MTEYLIPLSWPDKRLQPHAKGRWRPKAVATKAYRHEAFWSGKKHMVCNSPDAELIFSFFPPDNRRRDLHNMPSMMKPVIDGIADAMGCDDNAFRVTWPQSFGEVFKPGSVLVHIKPRTVIMPIVGTIS